MAIDRHVNVYAKVLSQGEVQPLRGRWRTVAEKSAILLWRGADAPVKGCSNRGWRADADPHAAALEFAGSAFCHACLGGGGVADLAASAEGRPPPIR